MNLGMVCYRTTTPLSGILALEHLMFNVFSARLCLSAGSGQIYTNDHHFQFISFSGSLHVTVPLEPTITSKGIIKFVTGSAEIFLELYTLESRPKKI